MKIAFLRKFIQVSRINCHEMLLKEQVGYTRKSDKMMFPDEVAISREASLRLRQVGYKGNKK